jgi:hypothetical protein
MDSAQILGDGPDLLGGPPCKILAQSGQWFGRGGQINPILESLFVKFFRRPSRPNPVIELAQNLLAGTPGGPLWAGGVFGAGRRKKVLDFPFLAQSCTTLHFLLDSKL